MSTGIQMSNDVGESGDQAIIGVGMSGGSFRCEGDLRRRELLGAAAE
jgi:hypothetical protein